MDVIITGGTGLIGRALAGSLVGDGHRVIVLSRRPDSATGLPHGVEVVGWDGETATGWGSLAEGAAIVHLAGESIAEGRWTDDKKKRIRDSRVRSSQAVTEAIAQASVKPPVLLQGSAVGYYGWGGDQPITEESPRGEGFLAEVCEQWEDATAPVEALGVRRAILRTGVVLSTEGGALPKIVTPFKLFAGGPVGSGKQWFPWIHIADEVGAIRFLLDHADASGPFNLSAPEPVTNKAFAAAVGRAMGRPSFMPAPAFALKLMLGEMAELVLKGQRAVPARLLELGYTFRFPTPDQALADLLD